MVLNSAKTKVMLITTNQKRHGLNRDGLNLNYNDDPLQTITNEKILGVFVDNNLTWSEHIKHYQRRLLQIYGCCQNKNVPITRTLCSVLQVLHTTSH